MNDLQLAMLMVDLYRLLETHSFSNDEKQIVLRAYNFVVEEAKKRNDLSTGA